MDQTLKSFLQRENISRYIELIKTEADPVKRAYMRRGLRVRIGRRRAGGRDIRHN